MVSVFSGWAPASVAYCRLTVTVEGLGFWIDRYSAKALSVDPSAKSHSVLGWLTPTTSVEPCQVPLSKCITRSAIPGPGSVTLADTCWSAPSSRLTGTRVTKPAVTGANVRNVRLFCMKKSSWATPLCCGIRIESDSSNPVPVKPSAK